MWKMPCKSSVSSWWHWYTEAQTSLTMAMQKKLSANRVGVRVVVESVEWGCGLDGPDLWLPFFWTVSAKAEDAVSQKEDHLRSAYSFLRHKHLKADRGKYQKQHEWQMLGGSSIYLTYPNLLCCPIARNSEHTQNTIRAHSENTQRALWKYSPHLQSVPSSAGRHFWEWPKRRRCWVKKRKMWNLWGGRGCPASRWLERPASKV